MNAEIEEIFDNAKTNPDVEKYIDYFESITPKTTHEIFWRFVFAFLSIHSTYTGNVRGYLMLRNPGAWRSQKDLCAALQASGCGMHNNRTKFLWKFREDYFEGKFSSLAMEPSLQKRRNMLTDRLFGIGLAKTSFALEMSFPMQYNVVCMDVHQLRLYGQDPTKLNKAAYEKCENDWCARSRKIGVPPFIVRNMFWDTLKKQPSPRFWSYVFEPRGDQVAVENAAGLTFDDDLLSKTDVTFEEICEVAQTTHEKHNNPLQSGVV